MIILFLEILLLFLKNYIVKYGVEVTFVDTTNLEEVKAAMRPNTKVVYTELVQSTKVNDLNLLQPKLEEESKALAKSLVEDKTFLDEITSSIIVEDILYATTTLTFIGSII